MWKQLRNGTESRQNVDTAVVIPTGRPSIGWSEIELGRLASSSAHRGPANNAGAPTVTQPDPEADRGHLLAEATRSEGTSEVA